MDFALGALASVGAVFFSNPFDVLKTKAQLQGELRGKGNYKRHYKNMFHAVYVIASDEGVLALQKGLAPAIFFQASLNGVRLGLFQVAENNQLTRKSDGSVSVWRTMLVSSGAGMLGAFVGSPFFLVKTQIQSQAPAAVTSSDPTVLGYQHKHKGFVSGLAGIYRRNGLKGLWAGSVSAMVRVAIGSGAQLSTFTVCREFVEDRKFFHPDAVWTKAFASSMMVGMVTALVMTPFETISTRLYNQERDANGRGVMYRGIFDCMKKTYKIERIRGLYKGLLPSYFRIGPHSMLNLMFWEKLKHLHRKYADSSL